jgi:drug/metabolite transporter (DMT)-like permease
MRSVGREAAVFVLLTLIWGTTWAAIRLGLDGIPPLTGVAARFALAGAILWVVARMRRVTLGGTAIERRLWVYNAFATFIVPYGVIYWAEQRVPSGLASILFATFPLWTVLIGRWVLPGERPSPGRLLSVVVGFLGVAVIFSEDFERLGGADVRLRGAALLGAAAVSASGSLAVKRWGAGISPFSAAAVPMLITGLVTGGAALAFERDLPLDPGIRPVLATLYLAVFGSAVTFTLYFWLLARRTAVAASLISYTAPVVAVLIGTWVFAEPFTLRVGLGAGLVLGGVALALRPGKP